MDLISQFGTSGFVVVLLSALVVTTWLATSYLRLSHVPGPFLARFTDLQRLSWVRASTPTAHDTHIHMHRRYGPIVRFGPNMVSVADPLAIPTIYGFGRVFPKSNFYHALMFYAKGRPAATIFNTQDDELHRRLRKPITPIYSMSNLRSFEDYVDSTIKVFVKRLDEQFAKPNDTCPLDQWLQYFAFDVMGEITYSRRLGFLESGKDVDGIVGSIWKHFQHASIMSQMPWLDFVWSKNPVYQFILRYRSTKASPIVAFALKCIGARQEAMKQTPRTTETSSEGPRDFLSRFLDIINDTPDIPPSALIAWTTSNIAAGSDTTAILLRTIFYNLIRNPESLDRLVKEIEEQEVASDTIPWIKARQMPYLDACIKEAGRLHPPFALPLERVVPFEGTTICGKRLPGGTVVGINGFTVHRDVATFGEDCDDWRPERWLCGEDKRRSMERALLTFGAGSRACLGKNISLLEIYKLVPSLLKNFKFSFAVGNEGGKNWRVENKWFSKQTGLNVQVQRR